MKLTKEELIKLFEQKRDNAKLDYERGVTQRRTIASRHELQGEVKAYIDTIVTLCETEIISEPIKENGTNEITKSYPPRFREIDPHIMLDAKKISSIQKFHDSIGISTDGRCVVEIKTLDANKLYQEFVDWWIYWSEH